MTLRVDECRRLLKPSNIFELLPRTVFEELIQGLYHGFGRGVVLLWAEYDSSLNKWVVDIGNRLEPKHPEDGDRPRDFSILCYELRRRTSVKRCVEYDCAVAQGYVDGTRVQPAPYTCWAGLKELAYPLQYGGETRAVLQAGGQIIPTDSREQAKIREAILSLQTGEELWSFLEPFVKEEHERQERRLGSGTSLLDESWRRVENLGKGLQGVIDRLYESRLDAATRLVQEDLQDIFAHADLTNRRTWWEDIHGLFPAFCHAVGLTGIDVFLRRNSQYRQAAATKDALVKATRFTARDVRQYIPTGKLIPVATTGVGSDVPDAFSSFRSCWAYRTEQKGERLKISTLLVIRGSIIESHRRFVEDFCRATTGLIDVASMMFEVREATEEYAERVGGIAHSFRTPLQAVLLETHHLLRRECDEDLRSRIEKMADRVLDAKTDIDILLRETRETHGEVDILCLITRVLMALGPQAREKRCWFQRDFRGLQNVTVRGSEYKLGKAMSNLVDNAVKYSWDNHAIDVTVKVLAGRMDGRTVEISISDYGLGFPEAKLEEIREYGIRGDARDPARPVRTGTGWGLAMAIDTVEKHDGWVEITSTPADLRTRARGEELHRFRTKIWVYLPCK